jgi:hypothetical protein
MKLSDFPPEMARDMIWQIIDRWKAAKDRQSFSGLRTECSLSVDQARLIYAAGQWLSRYDSWVDEAKKAKGSIGVYPADTSLSFCSKFLNDLSTNMNKTEPKIVLNDRDMTILNDCSIHLDHYHLLLSFNDGKKRHKR